MKKYLLKTIIIFIVIIGYSNLLLSQSNNWNTAPFQIQFVQSTSLLSLPNPNISNVQQVYPWFNLQVHQNLIYDGYYPNFHNNSFVDENGALLFFIIDNKIYDNEGFLIYGQEDDFNSDSEIHPHYSPEVIIIPINTAKKCQDFLIIVAGTRNAGIISHILSFDEWNPYFFNRKGKVISTSNFYSTVNNRDIEPGDEFGPNPDGVCRSIKMAISNVWQNKYRMLFISTCLKTYLFFIDIASDPLDIRQAFFLTGAPLDESRVNGIIN
jgi:hypothetical protein